MSRFSRSGSVVALVLVGCLGLVACGGGGSAKVSSAGNMTTTSTTAAGSGSSGSGSTGSGVPDTAACQAAFAGLAKASAGTFAGTDLDSEIKQLNAVAAAAPSDIKADLTTVVGVVADMAKALKDAGYDPTKTPTAADSAKLGAALTAIGPKFEDPAYTAAAEHVSAWFEAGCKSS